MCNYYSVFSPCDEKISLLWGRDEGVDQQTRRCLLHHDHDGDDGRDSHDQEDCDDNCDDLHLLIVEI